MSGSGEGEREEEEGREDAVEGELREELAGGEDPWVRVERAG